MSHLALASVKEYQIAESGRSCDVCGRPIQSGEVVRVYEIVDADSTDFDVEFFEFECPDCQNTLTHQWKTRVERT